MNIWNKFDYQASATTRYVAFEISKVDAWEKGSILKILSKI